ncbi:glycerophosphodiester phosphodiesterase [Nocardioides sp.]|uniref:glycerophosphodiester phosphodiesterase n=1 Tax=Nocardioides sp. TaxID=35761 RepID=UPI003528D9FF
MTAQTRPQVVAHRGASHESPEHTLGAYVRALEEGAEGLECDVRLTADGHLVCVHDRDLRRTALHPGVVSTMELAELDQLDFAAWKNPWADLDDEAPQADAAPGGVLTLRKLLETVADFERRVEIAIETKHPTRYGGLVERRLAEQLRDFGWHRAGSPARVMSFSYTAMQRMAGLTPELTLVMLIDKRAAWSMLEKVVARDWVIGPGIDLLQQHPRWAKRLAASGHDLHVWTVNTRAQLETCLDLGVKAVISDRPAHLLELLDTRAE